MKELETDTLANYYYCDYHKIVLLILLHIKYNHFMSS